MTSRSSASSSASKLFVQLPVPNPCFLPSSLTLPPISHTPHSELEGDDEWGRRLGFCRSLRGPKPEEGEELDENRGE